MHQNEVLIKSYFNAFIFHQFWPLDFVLNEFENLKKKFMYTLTREVDWFQRFKFVSFEVNPINFGVSLKKYFGVHIKP